MRVSFDVPVTGNPAVFAVPLTSNWLVSTVPDVVPALIRNW